MGSLVNWFFEERRSWCLPASDCIAVCDEEFSLRRFQRSLLELGYDEMCLQFITNYHGCGSQSFNALMHVKYFHCLSEISGQSLFCFKDTQPESIWFANVCVLYTSSMGLVDDKGIILDAVSMANMLNSAPDSFQMRVVSVYVDVIMLTIQRRECHLGLPF